MTKPRLAKVRALFYVLQQLTKEAAPILTQPRKYIANVLIRNPIRSAVIHFFRFADGNILSFLPQVLLFFYVYVHLQLLLTKINSLGRL